jgi:hypothetical protein
MAGVEERNEGRHIDDNNTITMRVLPLLLLLPDNLKKIKLTQLGGCGRQLKGGQL